MPRRSTTRVHYSIPAVGWMFIVIAATVGAAASRTQLSMVYLIFGSMAGGLLMSALISRRMIKAVELRREAGDRAWQNQTMHLGYHLRNSRKRGSCLSILVEEIAPKGIASAAGYCVHLPPGQAFRAGARFICRQRGRIVLRQIRLSTSFPFGLIRAWQRIEQDSSIIVWPARGRLKRQLLDRGAVEVSSSAPSAASGGQDEFFGLREYRPDDNPRWIHWRKSAAKVAPVVREMSRPRPDTLCVIVDTFCADMSDVTIAQREKLLRFAATLVDHAFSKGYHTAIALAYNGGFAACPPSTGRAHRAKLLDALADVDLNTTHRLEQTLERLDRRWLRNAQVIAIVPNLDRNGQMALGMVRGSCRHLGVIDASQVDQVYEDGTPVTEAADAPEKL